MLKQVKIDKTWRALKIDTIGKKVLKTYAMEKNKIIAARINCSKQIVWREQNRTVCLVLVSVV